MDKAVWLTLLAAAAALGLASARRAPDQDRTQILEHIHGIFRAYLAGDRAAIRRMHTSDWVGFQGPSVKIERGIEDYMRNAELSLEAFHGTGYELLESEVQLHGDLALVYYTARYDYRTAEGQHGSLHLRAIDVYRKQDGEWNQCGSHITPIPSAGSWGEQTRSAPRTLSEREREVLLATREAVWKAWFANDRVALERLLPEETIAIDPGIAPWADVREILRRSAAFAVSGAALESLEFPRTEILTYGDVALLFTEYRFRLVSSEGPTTVAGRGTEVFVRRDGRWLNPGWHLDSGS